MRFLFPRSFGATVRPSLKPEFVRRFWGAGQQALQTPLFVNTDEVPAIAQQCNFSKTVYMDVRSPTDYADGHIPSAVNVHDTFTYLLPTSHPDDIAGMNQFFSEKFGEAGITGNEDEYVVVYEAGLNKMYGSSCRGFFFLKHLGHPNVSVLHGGFNQYTADGGEVCSTVEAPEACQFKTNARTDITAGRDDILAVLDGSRKAYLLDVRDKDEWFGTTSSPYGVDFCPRKGRLPGAKWIEWYDFMTEGVPKTPEQVRALMKGQGISPEDDVIVYCFKGARAANTLMMLHAAGFSRVTNYVASWNEWSRDLDLPIDDTVLEA